MEKEETVSSRKILTATRKNAIIEGKDETEKNGKEKTKENKGELIENGEKNDEETQKEGRGREQVENEGKDDEKTPKEGEKTYIPYIPGFPIIPYPSDPKMCVIVQYFYFSLHSLFCC